MNLQEEGQQQGKQRGYIEKDTRRYIAAMEAWRKWYRSHPHIAFSEDDRLLFMNTFIAACSQK